jgi:hypothetical protein
MLAGMLVYELVHLLAPTRQRWFSDKRGKLSRHPAVGAGDRAITQGRTARIVYFKSDAGSLATCLRRWRRSSRGRGALPRWLVDGDAQDPDDIGCLARWFREHAAEMQSMGKEAGRVVILCAHQRHDQWGDDRAARGDVDWSRAGPPQRSHRTHLQPGFRLPPRRLRAGTDPLSNLFTAIYLVWYLPSSRELPFAKPDRRDVRGGLLPVVGNLISTRHRDRGPVLSSFGVALSSLVPHRHPQARVFPERRASSAHGSGARVELLLVAMLAMEAASASAGVVAAPITDAFIGDELKARA